MDSSDSPVTPPAILSLYTPDRSQGCRAAASAISRWSQSRPFCCFSGRKWTWLTHPRCEHTHKKIFGCLSKYSHLPKIFCGAESAGTYLYQSLEQHRERQLADIVFLRPRVCLAVRRKAPSARLAPSPKSMWNRHETLGGLHQISANCSKKAAKGMIFNIRSHYIFNNN